MSGKTTTRVCERETKDLFVIKILTVMWRREPWGWGERDFASVKRILMVSLRSSRSQSMALRQFLSSLVLQSSSSRLTWEHSDQQTLTHHRYDINIVLRLCASSFSLPLQNSTTSRSLKIWHVGGKGLKPDDEHSKQSPDVQMMSGDVRHRVCSEG